MTDWSGEDYARVSGLQRSMAEESIAGLTLSGDEHVLDIGCGDGFLTSEIARLAPSGYVVGADPSPRMVSTAHAVAATAGSGPRFVRADARALPFARAFDLAVSFNALHWVPEQELALAQIAAVLRPGARALLQMVCATRRTSLEEVAMQLTRSPYWRGHFDGFRAPFVHPDPDRYADLAVAAGFTVAAVTVTDRTWEFGSRDAFAHWCAVGSTAWTDRLPPAQRAAFVDEQVHTYETITGQPGLFLFAQLRITLTRVS